MPPPRVKDLSAALLDIVMHSMYNNIMQLYKAITYLMTFNAMMYTICVRAYIRGRRVVHFNYTQRWNY